MSYVTVSTVRKDGKVTSRSIAHPPSKEIEEQQRWVQRQTGIICTQGKEVEGRTWVDHRLIHCDQTYSIHRLDGR
jgi:hypothetical protein